MSYDREMFKQIHGHYPDEELCEERDRKLSELEKALREKGLLLEEAKDAEIARLKAEVESLKWWQGHGQKLRNAIFTHLMDLPGKSVFEVPTSDDDVEAQPEKTAKELARLKAEVENLQEKLSSIKTIMDGLSGQGLSLLGLDKVKEIADQPGWHLWCTYGKR